MKKIFLISLISFFFNTNLSAVTLSDALLEAYKNNPVLNAERENITKIIETSKKIFVLVAFIIPIIIVNYILPVALSDFYWQKAITIT